MNNSRIYSYIWL